MSGMRLVALVIVTAATADAAPFDRVFHAGATKLACTGENTSVAAVTCTIATTSSSTSRLACAGSGLDQMHGDLHEPFEPAVLARSARGITRNGVAWLAIPAAVAHWEQDDDPQRYSGTQHFTLAHGRDWCAAWWPFGYGGAPKAYAICFAPDGVLTGIAAIKTEGRTWSIRCGDAPEPESLLPDRLPP